VVREKNVLNDLGEILEYSDLTDTSATGGVDMTNILHVLSIGSADSSNAIHDALLERGHCRVSVATNYRELFAIPRQEVFEIAILHHITSPLEFRASSEYIRRTWPCAKILVICARAEVEVLDDPLYDDWIAASPSQDVLLGTIKRITAGGKRSGQRPEALGREGS
jgi:hypothetical protein